MTRRKSPELVKRGMAGAMPSHELCRALSRNCISAIDGGFGDVLPAEARVACDVVLEMDEISEDFRATGAGIASGDAGADNPLFCSDNSRLLFGAA